MEKVNSKETMDAQKLYSKLESDFITPEMSDDWAQYMEPVADFLSDNFKKRSMGVVCDFAREISRVYTAVFPTQEVMQQVLDGGVEDAMLFVHHPSIWDIRKAPEVFYQMDRKLLQQFKDRRIAIYNLHVPLDNYGGYSTTVNLAKAVQAEPLEPFAPYFGAMSGVIAKVPFKTTDDLKRQFEKAIGHQVSLYQYGAKEIADGNIGLVAGGGNDAETLRELVERGINTFVTGITVRNDHSEPAHWFAEKHGINLLGGTHYSTEKFACQAMCDYFEDLGLPTKFISGEPIFEDM